MYKLQIWQLKDIPENARLRFSPMKELKGEGPDKGKYECVYEEKDFSAGTCPCLEKIFARFQNDFDPPAAFKGHSLSVSDVIVITGPEGTESVFYTEPVGFKLTHWETRKPKPYTSTTLAAEAYTAAIAFGLIDDWVKIEDYFLPGREPVPVCDMEFDTVCIPSFGSNEGIYVDCSIIGYFDLSGEKKEKHIATLKTLEQNTGAMLTAGKLAGAMTAMVREVIYGNWDSFCPEKEASR